MLTEQRQTQQCSIHRPRHYWLALFSCSAWQRFLDEGAKVSSFRRRRWKTVRQIRPGDYLLCYLSGISRWTGLLEVASFPYLENVPLWEEVVSAPYFAQEPLWEADELPAKLRVRPVLTATRATSIPILSLKDELSIFRNLPSPNAWVARIRSSPARWTAADADAVIQALMASREASSIATTNHKEHEYKPLIFDSNRERITVAETEKVPHQTGEYVSAPREPTTHTEIQWLILKLGNDMGFDVWVARNDKGREYQGHKLSELPRIKDRLPLQFDKAINSIIEVIDILWLKGNAIVAAFEIESTSSIYSGLLRMADLVAMQPNLTIPLYLVAPDERRGKVIAEVNRPTFSRLSPPLNEICRLITFSELRAKVSRVAPFLRYLKADFLEEISESCIVDDT